MGEWHKTGCVMCAQNCGLEILVEDNRMVKVRPDKKKLSMFLLAARVNTSPIPKLTSSDKTTTNQSIQ